ncbi:hypothetical protein MTR_8g045000 [Medicago truncatula]|uniref:Uncharacterized protein n=1 Tax=Medicago truncatula TaxID=3880 RepID=G7L7P8_MEDTR|nr:hypothetical protein MTR_8g045000 [Medicago truncatula]
MATSSSLISIQDKKEKQLASLKQPLKAASSLKALVDLQLDCEKKALMKKYIFYNLLQVTYRRESSASLISLFCEVYDPVKKSFVFNNNVSFSFCAEEVAEVLGIKNTGNSLEYTAAERFPEFVYELKENFDPDGSRQIKTKGIKIFLEKMTIDDEQSRSNFKQLLSYFLIERFLLCCPDPKKTRVSSWGMVEDINAFEEVNWAKTIYDNICESFGKLKAVMHKQQQHYFLGCARVFEAIVFKRIKPLEPKANSGFAYLPIEKKVVIIVSTVRSAIKHNELTKSTVLAFSAIIEGQSLELNVVALCGQFILSGLGCALPESIEPKFSAAEDPHPKRRCLGITPCSYCGNLAENFLASGAESDSASSLKGVHDCLAEDSSLEDSSLVSAFVDICIDDVDICIYVASSQPSSPVNDAQPSAPVNDAQPPAIPPLRRSLRARKEVDRFSPS